MDSSNTSRPAGWTSCLLHALVYLVSLLPLWFLYGLSDLFFLLAYYLIRYRRRIVRSNLCGSFPEKTEREIVAIERRFYRFFCDYMVETVKLCSMSDREMRRRMRFAGVEQMVGALEREGKLFAFIYLAHYGNWEWVSSLSARVREVNPGITGGHIYHPLRNKPFNRLFLRMRSRFEGVNVPMKETLRFILQQRAGNRPTILGFIADQAPKWSSTHHWTTFLNRQTAVFTGTEQIARRVDALLFYARVERVRRGHYLCTIERMEGNLEQTPQFGMTDGYFRLLEADICRCPDIWLWTHNRWKRTYEQFLAMQKVSRDPSPAVSGEEARSAERD